MNDNETLEQTKARHSKHQDMLKQHSLEKSARQERGRNGLNRRHKQDSEMFGFKTLIVAKTR